VDTVGKETGFDAVYSLTAALNFQLPTAHRSSVICCTVYRLYAAAIRPRINKTLICPVLFEAFSETNEFLQNRESVILRPAA